MKLYRTSYTDDEFEAQGLPTRRSVWHGTQADAAAVRKAMKSDGMRQIDTEDIDVPTDKSGLIAWLNDNEAKDHPNE